MTQVAQDFTIYQGNGAAPQYTIVDGSGAPVNLTLLSDITWNAYRNAGDSVAVLSKTRSGGGITYVNSGTDGKFQVALAPGDTSALSGNYYYAAALVDSLASPSTVVTGTMTVGPAPSWSYSGDPSSSSKDAVRFLMGDTMPTDKQMYDGEIAFALTQRGTIYGAAAMVARALSAKLSRQADEVQGDQRIAYSVRAKSYLAMAAQLEQQEAMTGGIPVAGGLLLSDKQLQQLNSDRMPPQFTLGMTDNVIPLGRAGLETIPTTNAGWWCP